METENLPTYIPLSEAAERYRLSVGALNRAVERGTIKAVKVNGDVALAEKDVREMSIRRKNFQDLEKQPIHLSQAARKYNLPRGSLSRWATSGFIQVLGWEKNRRLLNEADIAYIRAMIDAIGLKSGQSLGSILPDNR